jgi:uncharacterized protein (DUF1330 family)
VTTYPVNHLRVPGRPEPQDLEYLEKVEATFLPSGGRWPAIDGEVEVLEGARPGSVVLMEFPDRESARTWYASPAYQGIVGPRTDNAVSDLVLVDPVSDDVTSAEWAQQIRSAGPTGVRPSHDTSQEQP